MVRRSGDSGFGRARPRYLCAAALIALLAGCASKAPDVGPWGYDFALGKFNDQRADDDAKLMAETPFSVDTFMDKWQSHAARSIFANRPALLDITLTRYEATQSGWSYAMSMEMKLRGRDIDGRVLADKALSCNVVNTRGAKAWSDSVQQVVTKGDLNALTIKGRAGTMWQEVWDSCVKDIEVQFGEALRARGSAS